MKKLLLGLLTLSLVSTLHAGKGKLRVSADHKGAFVYVDGKKKAMIGEGFNAILLEEGEYKVTVVKAVDANYEYSQSKKVFVGEDSSTKISFKLKRKMTAKGKVAEQAKRDRWKRSGNTVIDKKLGLEWQDNSKAKTTKKKWKSAKKYCKNLTLGGHSDWRLPSYDELLTIVDYDRYNPAIMPSFENVASNWYWSDSEYIGSSKSAWVVHFFNGYAYYYSKSSEYFVRCVRARQ